MAAQTYDYYTNAPEYSRREWDGHGGLAERATGLLRHSAGLTIASFALGILVVAAGIYFAPDAKRYMKMRHM